MSKLVQQEIPFSRYERREAIRDANIVAVDVATPGSKKPVKVRPSTQKHILKELDSYSEKNGTCFPSLDTLAKICSFSKRTVQNGLKALEMTGLVIVRERERKNSRGATSNAYTIVWEELSSLRSNNHTTEFDQVANYADQVATIADQVAEYADQVADAATHENITKTKEETTTKTAVVVASLKALGVGAAEKAIAEAVKLGRSIEAIQADIEAIERMAVEKRPPNHVYQWIIHGSRPPEPKHASKETTMRIDSERMKRARENMRYAIFKSAPEHWSNANESDIEAEIDRRMKPPTVARSPDGVGNNNLIAV